MSDIKISSVYKSLLLFLIENCAVQQLQQIIETLRKKIET